MNITQLFIGFLLSLGVAFIAYKKEKLTLSGLFSAILLGTIVYGFGSWIFYVWLMIFFMSSLLIQKFVVVFLPDKQHTQKHSARNWIQVFANGGILGYISILYFFYPTDLVIFAAALSMAASTSDTWASEIGSLSTDIPYGLISRKSITKGLSGGVTRLGLWASLWGSTLISMTYFILMMKSGAHLNLLFMALLCSVGGFMGSIVDSILGELVQAKYIDDKSMVVESKHDHQEKLIHGYSWLDNNMVNLLSNLIVVSLFSALLSLTGWIK